MTRQQLLIRLQSCTMPQRTIDDISHDGLQVLEPHDEQNFTWDEVSETSSETSRVADDVNGQAFSRQSLNASYLGLSSVPTILRVIVHLRPNVQRRVPEGPQAWRSPSMYSGSPDETCVMQVDETSLIDAYFDQIHPIIPMIDEAEFRCRYITEDLTQDETGSWLALLNMVLAMGSMASDSIHLTSHNIFYKRALSYINISSFGSGHIHMVQALALYSGMLLHFFNRPNTATAVMGATIQMAVAMGLHRVQATQANRDSPACPTAGTTSTRISTWWCLLCLDTWASSTLGRPSPGYWNPATVSTTTPSTLETLVSLCLIPHFMSKRWCAYKLSIISYKSLITYDHFIEPLRTFLFHFEDCEDSLISTPKRFESLMNCILDVGLCDNLTCL